MAYHQSFTYTTANQFLVDLAAFAAANGWAVDFNGVYNTSYRRLHFHKGSAHFDLYSVGGVQAFAYGCTGYESGNAPASQPGASAAKYFNGTAGRGGWLVSTANGIYIALLNANNNFFWGCMFLVDRKVGVWADGFGIVGIGGGAGFMGPQLYNSTYGYGQLYCEGAWTANNTAGNGFCGCNSNADISCKQPNVYNSGITPFGTVIFLIDPSDVSKKYPLGYMPGLYRANGGDVYSIGDEIVIGSDTYLILPSYGPAIGHGSYCDLVFKLGA